MAGTAMAAEIGRLTEKLRVLEAKVVESEAQTDCADVVVQELMFEMKQTESWLQDVSNRQQCIENSLEEFEKVQDWVADQIEELQKEARAVRQRLKYLLKKESLFEAQISQLQEEVKALREAFSTAAPSQPVAKKMPVPKRQPVMVEQSHGPPPKKSKAASKAANVTKLIIVKTKAASPAASRAEPSS